MRELRDCRLYGILDLGYVNEHDVERVAERMLAGGVDILQLRAKAMPRELIAKIASRLMRITTSAGAPLIVNDHPEIPADGAHVGQDDLSVSEARKITGKGRIVGKSTHSFEQAVKAEESGADYIGFGPLFATPTKPDYTAIGLDDIRRVHERARIPIFCIGGIKLENLNSVLSAGASRVVIVSGILLAADIEGYARQAKNILSSAAPHC